MSGEVSSFTAKCKFCGLVFSLENDHICPDEDLYVECDDACRALRDPKTPDEIYRAYIHWRFHHACCGCSHGR